MSSGATANRAADRENGDYSISILRGNLLSILFVLPLAALVFLPFQLIWGTNAVWEAWLTVDESFPQFMVCIVTAVLVHELLHLVGFRLAGADRDSVHLGFHLRLLTPYASCRAPLDVRWYRFSAALPGLVLGVLPMVGAWALGIGWLAVFAFWMLGGATGDALVLWLTRGIAPATLVVDDSARIGCVVPDTLTRAPTVPHTLSR